MHKVTFDLLVFELFRLFEFQHRLMTVSCSDIVTWNDAYIVEGLQAALSM